MQRILNFFLPIILGMAMLAGSLTAQQFAYSVNYSFDLKDATDAPKLGKLPRIEFPDEAVKKGIDGKMVVDVTLSADGKVGGIEFLESLPFGYEDEIRDAFRTFEFTPASNKGTAIDVVLRVEYVVTIAFEAHDPRIEKPDVTSRPGPVYPLIDGSDAPSGDVSVNVLLMKDGKVRIVSIESELPEAFKDSAREAASRIEFTPATLKDSKRPVTVTMKIAYAFKQR